MPLRVVSKEDQTTVVSKFHENPWEMNVGNFQEAKEEVLVAMSIQGCHPFHGDM